MDQYIIQLITDLYSNSTERNTDAAQELDEILLNPENFQFYLEILKSNENVYIRKFILISINRYIDVNNKVDSQYIVPLIEILVNIIQNDSDFRSRYHACEDISKFCNSQMFFELNEIIDLFLQNEELIPFAFIILKDSYLCLADYDSYDQKLIELFKEYVTSPNDEIQEITISFFRHYIFDIDNESILDDPSLFEVICKTLFSSIQENKESSVEWLKNLIYDFLDDHFEFITKYNNNFFDLAFECINDESIPIAIRAAVHQIFEKVDFIPEELLSQIMPISIKMSCELCSEENFNDKYDYSFNSEFFINALNQDNFNNNESFEFFISLIQNLSSSEDLCSIQASIYLLDLMVTCYSQFIGQIKEFIIQTIQFGLSQSNESIINITFELMNDVMDEKSYILKPIYNDIIRFFLDHEPNKYMAIFSNFCLFLLHMPEAPSNLGEIIEFSTKSFQDNGQYVRYFSIYCLNEAIRYYRPQNETEFSLLHLDVMMTDQENIAKVFELIKNLVNVFPISIKSIIQDIFTVIEQSFQDNYYELDSAISSLLCNLIEYFPDTMNNFSEQIQAVISFINEFLYTNTKHDSQSINENDIQHREEAIGSHLLLVASTFKFFDANEDMMMSIIQKLVNIEQNAYVDIAVKMISDKVDSNYFLSSAKYLGSSAMAEIILAKGAGNSSNEIRDHILSEFLTGPCFEDSVFTLINAFLMDGQKLSEPIIEEIQKNAENRDFIHQGWAILSLVYVAHSNDDKEAITNLLQNILSIINIDDLEQKLLLITAINVILIYYRDEIQFPEEISTIAQEFLDDQYATNYMKNQCILTLLLSNPQIDIDFAQRLFTILSFDDMSESSSFMLSQYIKELSVVITQYYIDNNETFSEVMTNLSFFAITLDSYIWIQIKEEVRCVMKQLLSNYSEEWIFNYLRQNEQKMNLFKKNIAI